jgi:hypothetical protein
MRKLVAVCRDAQLGIAKTSGARPTAFEAAPLIKPPALPGVSDSPSPSEVGDDIACETLGLRSKSTLLEIVGTKS